MYLEEQGRHEQAKAVFSELTAPWEEELRTNASGYSWKVAALGHWLLKAKQLKAAEAALRECLALRESQEPEAWVTFNTRSMLGGALRGQGRTDEAERLLVQGYEGLKERET